MNKPIRTMAIGCLALFLALLVNSTYLQYLQADDLNSRNDNKRVRDAEFSRERGAILVRGNSVAESVPVDDQFKFQRRYAQPLKYAHLTGFFSYIYGASGVESNQNTILSGSDSRFFVNRVVDTLSNKQPEGGSVSLTIDPAAQTAAFDGIQALGPDTQAAVVALEPSSGKILAMVSLLSIFGQGQSGANALMDIVRQIAPSSVDTMQGVVDQLSQSHAGGIGLIIGLLGALWSMSAYVGAFARTMNSVFQVEEGRPIWKLRPQIFLVTAVLLLLVATVATLLVVSGPVAVAIGRAVGLDLDVAADDLALGVVVDVAVGRGALTQGADRGE